MSPEQLRGERADARADVFSLGVVLFELLTGRHLFEGDSLEAIFFVTLTKKTPVLTTREGSVPPGLQKNSLSIRCQESREALPDHRGARRGHPSFLSGARAHAPRRRRLRHT